MIEAQVLGPVQVAVGGGWRELPAGRARALFALLLLAEGRPVAVEQLVEDLWAGRPPRSAVNFLHVLVSSLRKVLGADAISTHGRAYALAATRTDADAVQREAAVASDLATAGDEEASRRPGLSGERRANCLLGIVYFARPDRTASARAALRELDAMALDPLRCAARAVHGAMLALMGGEQALAEDRIAESEALLAALPADALAASHLAYHHRYNLALLAAEQGRHADAAAIYRGTVELAEREEHDLLAQAFAADLAAELVNAGEYQEAADVALDVLTRSHPEDVMFRSVAMHNRCIALCLLGDEAGAVSAALAAVRLALTIGTIGQNADLLLPLAAARVAGGAEDRAAAARLFGVWSAITGAVSGEVQPSAQEIIRRHLADVRDAADDSPLGRARAAGEALVASLGAADAVESVALAPEAPWASASDSLGHLDLPRAD